MQKRIKISANGRKKGNNINKAWQEKIREITKPKKYGNKGKGESQQ